MTKKFCALLLFLTLYCVIQAQDGWNNTTKAWLLTSSRNYFLQSAKNNKKDPIVSKAENREQMAICITNKIIESYTYSEYVALENDELTNFVHEKTHDCLQETGIKALYYDKYREDAERLGDKGKYGDAIEIYLSIDENGQADLIDYSNLGRMYVLDKQYSKAITYLLKGESLDNADLYIQAYLAHAYLLSGDFEKAVFIYKKYKGQNVDWGYDKKIWEEFIEDNFNSFKKEHIQCTRCDEIINLFKNTSTSYNSLPTTSNYDAQIE